MPSGYQVGVYYFPNYHVDPRNEAVHGPGWTEWELMKYATPRFQGHQQPKVPLWGYEDESDSEVFARKIDAAADHAIDHFIFDWYWYNDGLYLNRCLDQGYLKAVNRDRLKFAIMWANHDWHDIHPAKLHGEHKLLYPGGITREAFDSMTDYVIDKYFNQPEYWKIDDCPYFSIYELMTAINGLGGMEQARDAFLSFRRKTQSAGHPGLHLNAVTWGVQILPNEQRITDPNSMLAYLAFDSVTSYTWLHNIPLPDFPATPYEHVAEQAETVWHVLERDNNLPYYPNVSMGWDPSPRTIQSDKFIKAFYPYMATISGNTPEKFRQSLEGVKRFLDRRPENLRIMNINAWNEWTEGSYIEPDMVNGMGYLEAIKQVFGANW